MWTGLLGVGAEEPFAQSQVQPLVRPLVRPAAVAPLVTAPHFGSGTFARAASVG